MRTSTLFILLMLTSACTRGRDVTDAPAQRASSQPASVASVAPPPSVASESPVPSTQPSAGAGSDDAVLAALSPSGPSRMKSVPRGAVKQLSMGNGHVCAVMADDSLACGSVPDASFELGTIPQGRFTSVYSGMASTCAQKIDGTVVCFGNPRITDPAPTGPVARLCHDNSPCVERPDGTAECFHEGSADSLGRILPGSLACGSSWSCALTPESKIRCVVVDKVMAFGSEAMPAADWSLPKVTVKRVFSGYQHGCAIVEGGVVGCWGRDVRGETRPPKGAFTTLALGEKSSCGLRPDGSIECWGGAKVRAPRGPFTALAVTTHMDQGNTVCAVRADDKTLTCWAYGD